ncbi:helix-turn-helix transcriptional regulator [uncultured Azonexus sp.]|uniref:helix-turn-helix domain-containing protein n=1 Tax=uncultured Azonexus sp. TaxID=520307 RepID=UPI00261FA9AD|nr:helix-turn-helix transcriptional regulator [uncultured Azonexus sp.]
MSDSFENHAIIPETMNPFAIFLRQARLSRAKAQNALAFELGYEPSYLSALERGDKGPPKPEFINKLIHCLELTEEEQTLLRQAIEVSARQIAIPRNASSEEFRLMHQLSKKVGQLHPLQVHLIQCALSIPPGALESIDFFPIPTIREELKM